MASYEMIDVLTRLRELDKKNPNVISDAVSNTERMNGEQVDEAKKSAAQKKAQEKFKAMVKGKTADDKDSMDEAHKGAKPDFLDMDKDGNKKEPMKKAVKDAKKKVDETITITADSLEDLPVLQQIMKLAGLNKVSADDMPGSDNLPVMKADPSVGSCGDSEQEEGWDNEPEEEYKEYPNYANLFTRNKPQKFVRSQGDNPLEGIEEKLKDEYASFINERKLSKGEEKTKEKFVKGMKKTKGDFKDRYGKDAEAVMYATATKMAKKKA